jgi:hypothetical protein
MVFHMLICDGEVGESQGGYCGKATICISQNRQLVEETLWYHSVGCGRQLAGARPCQQVFKEEHSRQLFGGLNASYVDEYEVDVSNLRQEFKREMHDFELTKGMYYYYYY